MSGSIRDRDFEDGLCDVHGDTSIVPHDGLLLCLTSSDFGTLMPTKPQEESISSLELTNSAPPPNPRLSQLNPACWAGKGGREGLVGADEFRPASEPAAFAAQPCELARRWGPGGPRKTNTGLWLTGVTRPSVLAQPPPA